MINKILFWLFALTGFCYLPKLKHCGCSIPFTYERFVFLIVRLDCPNSRVINSQQTYNYSTIQNKYICMLFNTNKWFCSMPEDKSLLYPSEQLTFNSWLLLSPTIHYLYFCVCLYQIEQIAFCCVLWWTGKGFERRRWGFGFSVFH